MYQMNACCAMICNRFYPSGQVPSKNTNCSAWGFEYQNYNWTIPLYVCCWYHVELNKNYEFVSEVLNKWVKLYDNVTIIDVLFSCDHSFYYAYLEINYCWMHGLNAVPIMMLRPRITWKSEDNYNPDQTLCCPCSLSKPHSNTDCTCIFKM